VAGMVRRAASLVCNATTNGNTEEMQNTKNLTKSKKLLQSKFVILYNLGFMSILTKTIIYY
jgi:hypothetical protein